MKIYFILCIVINGFNALDPHSLASHIHTVIERTRALACSITWNFIYRKFENLIEIAHVDIYVLAGMKNLMGVMNKCVHNHTESKKKQTNKHTNTNWKAIEITSRNIFFDFFSFYMCILHARMNAARKVNCEYVDTHTHSHRKEKNIEK